MVDTFALEKMVPASFDRAFVSYRTVDIRSRIIDMTGLTLPTGALVHQFPLGGKVGGIDLMPDAMASYITNEAWPKYGEVITSLPVTGPFAIDPAVKVKYHPERFTTAVQSWFRSHPQIRRVRERSVVYGTHGVLPFLSYHLLSAAVYPSTPHMHTIQMETELRATLDVVESLVAYNRHQFLHFTVDGMVPRQVLNMAHSQGARDVTQPIDGSTAVIGGTFPKIMSSHLKANPRTTILLSHLVWFMQGSARSLFSKLSEVARQQLYILLDFGDHDTFGHRAIIYKLAMLPEFMSKDHQSWQNMLKLINVSAVQNAIGADSVHVTPDMDDAALDALVEEHLTDIITEAETDNTAKLKTAVMTMYDSTRDQGSQEFKIKRAEAAPFVEKVFKYADTHLAQPGLTQKQIDRISAVRDTWTTLSIGGQNLHHLLSTPLPPPPEHHLDFLEPELVDKSMAHSTITKYTEQYLQHMLHRDIAATVVDFSKEGLYLTSIAEQEVKNDIDQRVNYTLKFADKDGVTHSCRMSLPTIRKDGTFVVNGVVSRMTNQLINVPICKVSDTRVSISSAYNKVMVERHVSSANSFKAHFGKTIGAIMAQYGDRASFREGFATVEEGLPYEYTQVGAKFQEITAKGGTPETDFHGVFTYAGRFSVNAIMARLGKDWTVDALKKVEDQHGAIFAGTLGDVPLFMGKSNVLYTLSKIGSEPARVGSIIEVLQLSLGDNELVKYPPVEWCTLKVRDGVFPVGLALGYKYGFKNVLEKFDVDHVFVPTGVRMMGGPYRKYNIKFKDGTLYFPRYPLKSMLLIGGMTKMDFSNTYFADLDDPDGYFGVFQANGLKINYLKALDSFFKLFMDPITAEVLQEMGEPTDMDALLVRAVNMLTTDYHIQTSSVANHRLRGYERCASFLYRSLARAYEGFDTRRHQRRTFNMPPDEVFKTIVSDATTSGVEVINPSQSIKDMVMVTYAGSGGRTDQSFVTKDREFPRDGIGVLSNNTPDSGKVGLNAYLTANPALRSMRGLFKPHDLDPKNTSRVLSNVSMLLPGCTREAPARDNFASIQLGHQLPVEAAQCSRIRTQYETVMAHQCPNSFAHSADYDGVVDAIDTVLGVMTVSYDGLRVKPDKTIKIDGIPADTLKRLHTRREPIEVLIRYESGAGIPPDSIVNVGDLMFKVQSQHMFKDVKSAPKVANSVQSLTLAGPVQYLSLLPIPPVLPPQKEIVRVGESFTILSGEMHRQLVKPNMIVGERFKRGDILAYNAGFFEPDLDSKQVRWKHGIQAVVAFAPLGITMEDSCAVSHAFTKKAIINPAVPRNIAVTHEQAVTDMVKIGQEVDITTPLCKVDVASLYTDASLGEAEKDLLATLDNKQPKAKHAGRVADISVAYSGNPKDYHESVQKLIAASDKKKRALFEASRNTLSGDGYIPPGPIPANTKYAGTMFDEHTAVITTMITESLSSGHSDKLIFNTANKATIGYVFQVPPMSLAGDYIDAFVGDNEFFKRMVTSAFTVGQAQYVLMHAEKKFVELARKK